MLDVAIALIFVSALACIVSVRLDARDSKREQRQRRIRRRVRRIVRGNRM